MLKKPTSKSAVKGATQVVSFGVGAVLSDGATALVPAEHSTIGQAAIAGLSFLGAISYNGPGKEFVKPLLLGMTTQQGVKLGRAAAVKVIDPLTGGNAVSNFTNATFGLSGCGCNSQYTALNAAQMEWRDVWSGVAEDINFEEVDLTTALS